MAGDAKKALECGGHSADKGVAIVDRVAPDTAQREDDEFRLRYQAGVKSIRCANANAGATRAAPEQRSLNRHAAAAKGAKGHPPAPSACHRIIILVIRHLLLSTNICRQQYTLGFKYKAKILYDKQYR